MSIGAGPAWVCTNPNAAPKLRCTQPPAVPPGAQAFRSRTACYESPSCRPTVVDTEIPDWLTDEHVGVVYNAMSKSFHGTLGKGEQERADALLLGMLERLGDVKTVESITFGAAPTFSEGDSAHETASDDEELSSAVPSEFSALTHEISAKVDSFKARGRKPPLAQDEVKDERTELMQMQPRVRDGKALVSAEAKLDELCKLMQLIAPKVLAQEELLNLIVNTANEQSRKMDDVSDAVQGVRDATDDGVSIMKDVQKDAKAIKTGVQKLVDRGEISIWDIFMTWDSWGIFGERATKYTQYASERISDIKTNFRKRSFALALLAALRLGAASVTFLPFMWKWSILANATQDIRNGLAGKLTFTLVLGVMWYVAACATSSLFPIMSGSMIDKPVTKVIFKGAMAGVEIVVPFVKWSVSESDVMTNTVLPYLYMVLTYISSTIDMVLKAPYVGRAMQSSGLGGAQQIINSVAKHLGNATATTIDVTPPVHTMPPVPAMDPQEALRIVLQAAAYGVRHDGPHVAMSEQQHLREQLLAEQALRAAEKAESECRYARDLGMVESVVTCAQVTGFLLAFVMIKRLWRPPALAKA